MKMKLSFLGTIACVSGLALLIAAKPVPPPAGPLPDATPVLGATAGEWTCTDKRGAPARYAVRDTQGVAVLVADVPFLAMDCSRSVESNTEVTAVLRLANDSAQPTFKMAGGLSGGTNLSGFALTVGAAAGADSASVNMRSAAQGHREYLARKDYRVRWITKRSLGAPEDIRKIVEYQMASLPRLSQKWMKLRWQVLSDGTRVYLDDRLMWQSDSNTAGRFRMELTKGVELASLKIEPLSGPTLVSREKPGFEPIALDGYLNTAVLEGSKLKPDGLPAAGVPADVGGVPFVRPRPDARGNDHIELRPSWLQNGFLGGRDSPRDGAFGGRWAGAWAVNPARIQFTVPKGRFSAIHLLAAADSDPNSLPIVTAQFYVPEAGRPVMTAPVTVRRFDASADSAVALPAALENGKKGNLFLVTIPVEPGSLANFDTLEMELTKGVTLYRAWPDPMYYSFHQAGLPSSVHVFAMTLEQPPVSVALKAANGLHVWTAPEKPAYEVSLKAIRPVKRVTLELGTTSYDGQEKTVQKKEVVFAADGKGSARFELDLKKFGFHDLTLSVSTGAVFQTERRGLALLHPDTRERGNWQRGQGPIFGFWNWRGGHGTPVEPIPTILMGMAGSETDHGSFDEKTPPAGLEAARKYGIKGFKAFGSGDHYMTGNFAGELQTLGLAAARSNFVATMAKRYVKPDDLNRPTFVSFYAEPSIGLHTAGVPLSYDGLSETNDFVFTAAEEARFQSFLKGFVEGAKIVKEFYPDVQCLLPHGDPVFPVPFLRRSAEARKLIDGVTVDIPVFERMPESQFHQVALHRLYISRNEFRKAGNPNPWLPMYEGPCLPTRPGSLNRDEHAALSVRDSIALLVYGVDFQTGGWSCFDTGSYWGEQHYGGGICEAQPLATPKPSYAAFAAMTRHLNRRNFVKGVPTGSLSTYALQFLHYKDGSRMHAFWTVRGRRPVSVKVPAGSKVSVFDSMDNAIEAPVRDGKASFTVGQSPCFVYGLPESPVISLGEADHSDAAPAADALALASLGDGSWSVSKERDLEFEDSVKAFVRRYPTAMSVKTVEAPADKSGAALAVHLEKPERECRTMPYYTTLVPKKPVLIPGKAGHLGIWVKAASDWGRVVYSVRDAKGERWLSVGTKGAWNCDDIHLWSCFNFDGWRYLKFELPAVSPYDRFREAGMTWWGSYSAGDRVPDLPLTIEKILVERRTHAMYVEDPQPASPDDVLLGGLFAEYEKPEDKTDRPIQLAALKMPVPAGVPDMDNPILALEADGVGAATSITNISIPLHESDGTQCYVQFALVPEAAEYEIWASPYPDGRGAVKMAEKLKASNVRVRGFRPDTDFFLYIAYKDAKGKVSKPSKAYPINLKDTFAMK